MTDKPSVRSPDSPLTGGRFQLQKLPGWIIHCLMWARQVGLYLLEPLDYISRVVNGKKDMPPLAVRRHAGPLYGIESSGSEFLAYLKLLCQVDAHTRVLDIGCGFGLMALYLKEYLKAPGSYVGLDINRGAVKWAQKTISRKHSHFQFVHLDINNDMYNPHGKLNAEDLKFAFDDGSFDFILLKSVFTHMLTKEVGNYLEEVARLLAPGRVCLATFFLLNEAQEELQMRGEGSLDFNYGDEFCRYAVEGIPEIAVAYREAELKRLIHDQGLSVKKIHFGTWSGREDGISYQDIVLIAHG